MLLVRRTLQTFALLTAVTLGVPVMAARAQDWQVTDAAKSSKEGIVIASEKAATPIIVDNNDYAVVSLAANLLGDDIARVTGKRPAIRSEIGTESQVVLVGTLGHSALIDQLDKQGKLKTSKNLRGKWEASACEILDNPFPGVKRAFVIVGSDRRGTAYGMMTLSERIGVSPWYWWADVPVVHRSSIAVTAGSKSPAIDAPDVKYRGIFINDEDGGLAPWAAKTFDPELKNIGPKTYDKVFELMLRLKLNYLWPAMHHCSTEFGSIPENSVLADKYAIVMGASHAEPMLRNNIWWKNSDGPWNYGTNAKNIDAYWTEGVKARGQYEAVWTLGIRGIHDTPMQGPADMPGRVALVDKVIQKQQSLLSQYVSSEWGPIAQCFVPYKEVQPIYDAGLPVPPEVTLMWADDNYGYVRRFSNPEERKRSGGAGVYYHLSYLGFPHSYVWLNTTPPALLWEELSKAWDNDARTMWVLNVGDIKPGEIGVDCYARLAWDAATTGSDMQPRFLKDFATSTFGKTNATEVAALLTEYYRIGQMRKPEAMNREWAAELTPEQVNRFSELYQKLLDRESALARKIPADTQDAYKETVGYPARMLAASGLVYLEERAARLAGAPDPTQVEPVKKWHDYMERETRDYNENVAGGKWRNMMTLGMFDGSGANWKNAQFPWLRKPESKPLPLSQYNKVSEGKTLPIAAAAFRNKKDQPDGRWVVVEGLGYSAKALALQTRRTESWEPGTGSANNAPRLEYEFENRDMTGGQAKAMIHLLPTFRIYPGKLLRIAVQVDSGKTQILEVPASSGAEQENGPTRRGAVLDNRASLPVLIPNLPAGKHTLRITAIDPGIVLDQITLAL